MAREIKFRAKHVATKKWVYGGYAEYDDHAFIMENGDSIVVDPSTIGQFVGIKDKNGVDIYEGDILKGQTFNSFNSGSFECWMVVWCDDCHGFGIVRVSKDDFKYDERDAAPRHELGELFDSGEEILEIDSMRSWEIVGNKYDGVEGGEG